MKDIATCSIPTLNIRPAVLSDAAQMAVLSEQLGYLTDEQSVRQRLAIMSQNTNDRIWVAVTADGTLLGWVHGFYAIRLESGEFVEIGGLVVSQDARQQGAGRCLVSEVAAWARSLTCSRLRVRCNAQRAGAHQFYQRLGFAENKVQKVFDQRL